MPYRYFFILIPLVIVGSLCSIQAKQESRARPTHDRVAIVPGNLSPVRKSAEETAENSKAAEKKKKKQEKEEKKKQEQPKAGNKVSPQKNKPAFPPSAPSSQRVNPGQPVRVNPGQTDRIQQKPAAGAVGKVAIIPGKTPSLTTQAPDKKKKPSAVQEATAAMLQKKPAQPARPARPMIYTPPRPENKNVFEKAGPRVAIVPNAMPQTAPQPIAYPVTVVNVVVETPKRPIVISRPLPQTIVIDRRSAAYPHATLAPYAISPKGDFIQLEDGSQWKVRHRHYRTVKRWSPTDTILIETGKFFTWSAYKLVNYSKNEFVDVELIEPTSNGALSHWITEINVYEGFLRLQDGSIWRMSTNELLNWRVNDDVVVALSKDWFSSHSSYVLINPRVRNRLIAIFSY